MRRRARDRVVERIIAQANEHGLPIQRTERPGPYWTVPDTIQWLVGAGDTDREELGHHVAAAMRRATPSDWRRLPGGFRSPRIRPATIQALGKLEPDVAVELLGIATLNASGYTREAALSALAVLGHPRAVPYVLLRLGDWVDQVHQAAVRALRTLIARGAQSELFAHHDLVERLGAIERVELSSVEAEIRNHLRAPESLPFLEAGMRADRAETRHFCFRLMGSGLDGRPDLLDLAARDRHTAIRRWLAREHAQGRISLPPDYLRSLLRDSSDRVSMTMICALSREQVVTHREELVELAMAQARTVREAARFTLGRVESQGLASQCRSRLGDLPMEAVWPGLVACLGETGDASDFPRLVVFLDHRRPRVRAAAVTATSHVDGQRAAARVVPLLADSSGRVRRAVMAALTRAPRAHWADGAWRILVGGPEGGRVAALRLLIAGGGWDAMPALLNAFVDRSDVVQQWAWRGVCSWMQRNRVRGWLRPSAVDLAAIEQVWPRVRSSDQPPNWAARDWSGLRDWIESLIGPSPH